MSKLIPVERNNVIVGYQFPCPGCRNYHVVHVKPFRNELNASWTWNGSVDQPTFQPSILSQTKHPTSEKVYICHSWVQDGKIRFLSDCTHKLAGELVELHNIEPT